MAALPALLAEQVLEQFALALQAMPEDSSLANLQAAYERLRAAFAQVLFGHKKAPADHYAWRLMSHDASRCLERLGAAHTVWQNARTNVSFRLAYQRELADLKWITATAMHCKP